MKNILCRPRTAAAAEVMWSGRYDKHGTKRDVGEAMPRMFDWRYRLVRRGIQAEAIQPLWWWVQNTGLVLQPAYGFIYLFCFLFCFFSATHIAARIRTCATANTRRLCYPKMVMHSPPRMYKRKHSITPRTGTFLTRADRSKTDKANMTGAIHVEPLQTRSFTVSHDIYS